MKMYFCFVLPPNDTHWDYLKYFIIIIIICHGQGSSNKVDPVKDTHSSYFTT